MEKRDNAWLETLLYELWEDHFNDIPRKNLVLIKFGRRSKRQLGSIKWVKVSTKVKTLLRKKRDEFEHQDDNRISLITITSLYKSTRIPEYVVKETIAHEMIHYAHGFFSPLKKMFHHPHQGGLIRKEMEARGLGQLHRRSKKWLKEHWRYR
jgi:hypothetical protein